MNKNKAKDWLDMPIPTRIKVRTDLMFLLTEIAEQQRFTLDFDNSESKETLARTADDICQTIKDDIVKQINEIYISLLEERRKFPDEKIGRSEFSVLITKIEMVNEILKLLK